MSGALGFQAKRASERAAEMREPVQRSLFGDDEPVRQSDPGAEAAQFRATSYETVRQLLDHVRLPGGHWVEPCAGDGAIVRHVAQWCDTNAPSFRPAHDLSASCTVDALGARRNVRSADRIRGAAMSVRHDNDEYVWVECNDCLGDGGGHGGDDDLGRCIRCQGWGEVRVYCAECDEAEEVLQ